MTVYEYKCIEMILHLYTYSHIYICICTYTHISIQVCTKCLFTPSTVKPRSALVAVIIVILNFGKGLKFWLSHARVVASLLPVFPGAGWFPISSNYSNSSFILLLLNGEFPWVWLLIKLHQDFSQMLFGLQRTDKPMFTFQIIWESLWA